MQFYLFLRALVNLFIPKDQVGSDRKIQLTVEIHVGNRAGYANDTILRISDLTAPPEI